MGKSAPLQRSGLPLVGAGQMQQMEVPLAKWKRLVEILRAMDRILVAFSGGVDSSFLARAAREAVGRRALLVTADSETYPSSELAEARRIAKLIGLPHRIVGTRELERTEYADNPPNRCYFCKDELFSTLAAVAREHGEATIVYGALMDDLGDHRPGMQAAREHSVRAPLIEAELWKEEIRLLSRQLGLPTWDKPSYACLSSRFQYGDRITVEKLQCIDLAETHMRDLGFRQFRVRHHGRLARLEVASDELSLIWKNGRYQSIASRLRELGYTYVTVDISGFRSGSANEGLKWTEEK